METSLFDGASMVTVKKRFFSNFFSGFYTSLFDKYEKFICPLKCGSIFLCQQERRVCKHSVIRTQMQRTFGGKKLCFHWRYISSPLCPRNFSSLYDFPVNDSLIRVAFSFEIRAEDRDWFSARKKEKINKIKYNKMKISSES